MGGRRGLGRGASSVESKSKAWAGRGARASRCTGMWGWAWVLMGEGNAASGPHWGARPPRFRLQWPREQWRTPATRPLQALALPSQAGIESRIKINFSSASQQQLLGLSLVHPVFDCTEHALPCRAGARSPRAGIMCPAGASGRPLFTLPVKRFSQDSSGAGRALCSRAPPGDPTHGWRERRTQGPAAQEIRDARCELCLQ